MDLNNDKIDKAISKITKKDFDKWNKKDQARSSTIQFTKWLLEVTYPDLDPKGRLCIKPNTKIPFKNATDRFKTIGELYNIWTSSKSSPHP